MAANYKCTSVGCYSYQSPETNVLLQKLQTVINQFAQVIVFDPIKVDGIIGKGTTEKALVVLGYLDETDKGVIGQAARALEAQINTPEQLTMAAQAVTDTLVYATKQSALAAQTTPAAPLPAPTPAPTTAQLATTTANVPTKTTSPATKSRINAVRINNPALKASLLDRMPPWAAYASGAALALGALVTVLTVSKRRRAAAAAPVAGRYW